MGVTLKQCPPGRGFLFGCSGHCGIFLLMKIITLNTWGGRAGKENLLAFLKSHAGTTDVFCLQEIWMYPHGKLGGRLAGGVMLDYSRIMINGVKEIAEQLPYFNTFFRPSIDDNYGLLALVRKNINVVHEGDVFVYKEKGYVSDKDVGNHARNLQHITLKTERGLITVINFHGLWTDKPEGKGKQDIPERIEQSEKIVQYTQTLGNPFVLCGDFNLLPTTESVKILERGGMRNLVVENSIASTRTSHYLKPEKFADYIFVSKDLVVKDFKVLSDEVSDHAPLVVEVDF